MKGRLKVYRAEIEDDNFEIILAENDKEAIKEMRTLQEEGHTVFNLFLLDGNYNEIKTIF